MKKSRYSAEQVPFYLRQETQHQISLITQNDGLSILNTGPCILWCRTGNQNQ